MPVHIKVKKKKKFLLKLYLELPNAFFILELGKSRIMEKF